MNSRQTPASPSQPHRGRARRARLRSAAAALLVIGAGACANPLDQLAGGSAASMSRIDQLAVALQTRFTNVERSGRFDEIRARLIPNALNPSRLFDDSSLWTAPRTATTRALLARGRLVNGSYRFEPVRSSFALTAPGESRHAMTLTRLRRDEFRWETAVDLAAGNVTAADVATLTRLVFAAPEGRPGPDLRRDIARRFPRTAAALARGFVIDSLGTAAAGSGATAVHLRLRVAAERLELTHPHFARWIAKYAWGSESRFVLADDAGRVYLEVSGAKALFTVRYRVKDGRLVASAGAPMGMPDTLRLTSHVLLRSKLFTVGVRRLQTTVIRDSTATSRGWTVTGREEPDWVLPLITERLIGGSLSRPFEGRGAMFYLGVRDSAGGPALLTRRARVEVEEGTIMRMLNGVVAKVFADRSPQVEREEAAFLRDVFGAFQRDTRALAGVSDENDEAPRSR